jgi:outer membrane receptor protein involved in Fe transport
MVSSSLRARVGVVVALLFVLNAGIGFSQIDTGAIVGRVTDTTGAVVPAASVQLQNTGTGLSRTVQTDSEGRYSARSLQIGSYTVTVQQPGFQTQVRSGIVLSVGGELVVNLELSVGAVSEKVEVVGEAPAIETTNATVSALVTGEQVRDLPLNGRNIEQLALLVPGTFQDNAVSTNSVILGTGMRLTVNGGRPDSNLYLLDGTVVNDHALNGPNSATGSALGVEGVQEFRLITHNFSAEFGRTSGGVMSMVTRSGTNQLHGSVYEFVRNNIFDARNFFNVANAPNPSPLPPYRRNQFGAAVGGPVIKDRIFFFANYEGLRRRQGLSAVTYVPDLNARKGLLPAQPNGACPARSIAAGGGLCQVNLNPAIVPYLALWPLPNGRSFGDGTAELTADNSVKATENYAMERMDFRLSDKDSIFWRYVFNPAEFTQPNPVPTSYKAAETTSHFVTMSETHLFSGSTLNEFRFAFNRTVPVDINDWFLSREAQRALEFVPGAGLGQLRPSGGGGSAEAGGVFTDVGSARSTQFFIQNLFQSADTISLVRGAHSLKFGIDLQRIQLNIRAGRPRGEMRFDSLQTLLEGTAARYRGLAVGGSLSERRGFRRIYYGGFVQDDYRVTPRLTLNLGLRHEFFTDPTEVNGLIGNLVNPLTDNKFTDKATFHTSKWNFSPRFGLAWDPTGSGKSSIRGGSGLFFNHVEGRTYWREASLDPDYQTEVQLRSPIPFPHVFDRGFSLTSLSAATLPPNMDIPAVVHYNVEIQRELFPTLSLRAGYVGAYGYNQVRKNQYNLRVPITCQNGVPAACAGVPNGTKYVVPNSPFRNPNFADITRIEPDAIYNYNALQMVIQKNVSAGLRVSTSYTWSHSLSDADQVINSQTGAAQTGAQDVLDLEAEYSHSVYDQRHTLVMNGSYDMPWNNMLKSGLSKALLGGWTTNWIYSYGSGLPVNIGLGFENSGEGNLDQADRPNLVPGFSNNPTHGVTAGCGGVIPAGQKLHTPDRWYDPCAFSVAAPGFFGNLGRNTIVGPKKNRVDISLVEITSLTESKKLEFRAEFFNIFNHPFFTLPQNLVFTSTRLHGGNEGRIAATAGSNREIELGMKLTF